MSSFGLTQLHLRNPWVVAFFSFSFPGFGYLMLQRYFVAFIFIGWEVFINDRAQVNLGILYTLLGDFEQAKKVLDARWLFLYVTIYLFNIWDSYRATIDINRQYLLAAREDAKFPVFKMSNWDLHFLDRKKPRLAFFWSMLAPGVGHLYVHKVITGLFIFAATTSLVTLSHFPLALHHTAAGHFNLVRQELNMQWFLYLPSMFSFIYYDAYISVVEQNKLFEQEQAQFLKQKYQNPQFPMPFRERQ